MKQPIKLSAIYTPMELDGIRKVFDLNENEGDPLSLEEKDLTEH